MKLSVLIRGLNFSEKDRFGFPMDARENAASIVEKVLSPIRAANSEAKVYLVTYDSPVLQEVRQAFEPCELILLNAAGSSQAETYKEGLKHIYEKDDCDAVVAIRFDLAFKKRFDEWNVNITDDVIYFPWKEYLKYWRDHRRVGDAVHIIGRKMMSPFHSAIIMTQLAGRKDMHLIFYFLRTMVGNMKFIEDGYWDSNTVYSAPELDNPLYRIFNRPQFIESPLSPNAGYNEIKTE